MLLEKIKMMRRAVMTTKGFGFLVGLIVIQGVTGDPKGYHGEYDNYDDIGDPYNNNFVPVVKKVVDYYSKPKYAFGYEVDGLDAYNNLLSHGRWEVRDGDVTQGQYRVLLPDGRIQIVSYIADKFGYRPTIQYINKGIHPPPPPAYAHVKVPHFIEPESLPVLKVQGPLGYPGGHGHGLGHGYDDYPHPHPVKLRVNPIAVAPIIPPYPQYGAGYGYGFDPFLALGSSNTNKVARKRALLYDRTLFRKDVERQRRSNTNKKA